MSGRVATYPFLDYLRKRQREVLLEAAELKRLIAENEKLLSR